MENASKALLMAAGVLIGLLVLSLAVYLFMSFGAESQEIYAEIENKQLNKYNAQFNVYSGREDITIYEIISLANLAKENNLSNQTYTDYETKYKVEIFMQSAGIYSGNVETFDKGKLQTMLENYSQVDATTADIATLFKCVSVTYNTFGRVSRVTFAPN